MDKRIVSPLAKQRAAVLILDVLARTKPTIPHTWSEDELTDTMIEVARFELGLRGIAVGQAPRITRALGRETGHQVRIRGVKGVK